MDKLPVRNKIVIGEGTDYEKTILLQRPKGRRAREMMPKVLDFMTKLSQVQESGSGGVSDVSKLIGAFWDYEEFEKTLVPYVLQMEDDEGRRYLNEEGTLGDILDAYIQAAQYLIEESFNRKEVQEALGKSKGAGEAKTK